MTPIQLIQQELKRHNQDDVISSIYLSLKAKKSVDSSVVFRSKSFICEDDVKIYLDEVITSNYLCELVKKHRFPEFLEYLFEVLCLSRLDYEAILEDCKHRNQLLSTMKQPYIFVDTNFRRKNEQLHTLALLNDKRYIRLNKNLYLDLNEEEINSHVSNAIKLHYKWRCGSLPVFGKITAYLYCDNKGNKTSYNCLGKIINKEVLESQVIIKLGNKTFIGGIQ
jgi:hypothetical protein